MKFTSFLYRVQFLNTKIVPASVVLSCQDGLIMMSTNTSTPKINIPFISHNVTHLYTVLHHEQTHNHQ